MCWPAIHVYGEKFFKKKTVLSRDTAKKDYSKLPKKTVLRRDTGEWTRKQIADVQYNALTCTPPT